MNTVQSDDKYRILNNNDLHKRKGRLIVSKEFILNADENLLREMFSNFFPIDIERYHYRVFYDSLEYVGVSPHFEIVEETCAIPQYTMVFETDINGASKFIRFDKL